MKQQTTLLARLVDAGKTEPFAGPKIKADQIFSDKETCDEGWVESKHNFLIPPFDEFWIEGVIPQDNSCQKFIIGGFVVSLDLSQNKPIPERLRSHLGETLGCIEASPNIKSIRAIKRQASSIEENIRKFHAIAAYAMTRIPGADPSKSEIVIKSLREKCTETMGWIEASRWIVSYKIFSWSKYVEGTLAYDHGNVIELIDPQGKPVTNPLVFGLQPLKETDEEALVQSVDMINGFSRRLAYTTVVMSCKNVELVDQPTRPAKKEKGKDKMKKYVFKTLVVRPIGKRKRRAGKEEESTGPRKRLHLVAGHMANYEKGKGLFGKYHGRFYFPSHMRGSSEHGIIFKDYEVAE